MEDFDDIYAIWMQDHVIPFMTFERLPKEQFKPIFETLMQSSEVYVIEDNGHVVATRRIIPSSGEHAHSVEFASFGVDKDHLRKGYGRQFYEFLIDKIKKEKPDVKRIEIGQETDNAVALDLALKMGFKPEVIFTDWIRRETEPEEYKSKWNVGARFMALLIDPAFEKKSISNVEKYSPRMPPFLPDKDLADNIKIGVDQEKKRAICYYRNKLLGVCDFTQGVRRFGHVQFWDIKLEPDCNLLQWRFVCASCFVMQHNSAKT